MSASARTDRARLMAARPLRTDGLMVVVCASHVLVVVVRCEPLPM